MSRYSFFCDYHSRLRMRSETSFQSTWSLAGELRPNNVKHVHALLVFFAAMIAPIFSASAQTMDVGMDLGVELRRFADNRGH